VIFSVAVIHLLADGINQLLTTSDFPVGLTLCALGVLLTLGIETASIALISGMTTPCPPESTIAKGIADEEVAEKGVIEGQSIERCVHERQLDHQHNHAHLLVADKNPMRATMKFVILDASMALHSVIIGVSLGALGKNAFYCMAYLL
jgi:hypothetical protein